MSTRFLLTTAIAASASFYLQVAGESFQDPLPSVAILVSLLVTIGFEFDRMLRQGREKQRQLDTMLSGGPDRLVTAMEISRLLQLTDLELDRYAELEARISRQMGFSQ